MQAVQLTTQVAFGASDTLHGHVDGFLIRQADGSDRREPDTIKAIMDHLVAEVLRACLTESANRTGLDKKGRRVVDTTTKTVNKAAGFILSRAVHKLDIEQHRGIAGYMASLRLLHDGGASSSVAFPLPADLAADGRDILGTIIDGGGARKNPKLLSFVQDLAVVGTEYYLDQPLKIMKFGPILQSVSNTGTSAIRKAVLFTIKELIPTLDQRQSIALSEYLLELIQDHPVSERTPLGIHAA